MKKKHSPKERAFNEECGWRIAAIRDSIGMTQADLAVLSRQSRTTIANLETGRQGMSFMQAILLAKALRVPLKRLIPFNWGAE